jgi:AcrR family transcriptional regulator
VDVFAGLGYRDATLREICRRAGANNAAINYHFRDKEHLYLAVIEYIIQDVRAHMLHSGADPSAPPEERLGSFVRSFLRDLLRDKSPNRIMLITREFIEPTRGLDVVAEKIAEPLLGELKSIVRELIGPSASEDQVFDCAISVFGQCGEYHRGRAILSRVGPYKAFDEAVVEHLADHITRFSLAGIRAIAKPEATNQER